MSLWVVVGGQYGSEGKGKVSAFITLQEDIGFCVRCGGPNSGHSFVDESGTQKVLRQLPTGYLNPRTRLLLPAGALIDPLVLKQELESFAIDPRRVGIDRNCFVIEERDRETEKNLALRERLSSTLCGVGGAVARRALRVEGTLATEAAEMHDWLKPLLTDVSAELNEALDTEKKVLVEGTQGFGLSLYHSEHYPKTTSRDTTAAGFLSEVGLSPRLVTEVVVVLRTFPIRVAGKQAGPLRDEITWEQLRVESGYPHDIDEWTSVTKKIRRVGRFDWELAARAVQINRPTRLAINGLDYLNFSDKTVHNCEQLSARSREFINHLEARLGVRVHYAGTGPSIDEMVRLEPRVLQAVHPVGQQRLNENHEGYVYGEKEDSL